MHGHTHQSKHKKKTITSKENMFKQHSYEYYAIINGDKGCANFEVTLCSNNEVVIAHARGAISKGPRKQKLEKNDVILIQKSDCTTGKDRYDILYKYSQDEIKTLRKSGELSQIKDEEKSQPHSSVIFASDIASKISEMNNDEALINIDDI